MNNQEGKIWYGLGIDNTGLQRDAEKSKSIFRGIGTQAASDCAKMEQGYNALGLSIQGLGKKLATLGGAVAIEEMARALYNFSSNFNKAMLEVATISDSVSSDIETAKEKILELTTEVPIAADEATKALYQIVSAGYDGAEGMNVLEVSAKAAVGGVTETATAADAITSLLNAYKLSADEAETVSDKLFTTVRLGKTDWDQLGTKIAGVAPLAANFGIEMEQVLAGIATLTASGTPTAEAVTQIRASIVAANKVLGDGAFQTRTLQEGLAEIAEMAGGSESKLKELVPEIEAMNGVLGMTGLNAQKASEHLAEFGNIDGASQGAFVKTLEDSNLQLTLLKNNALATFSGLGDGIRASAGNIAKYLNEAFESGDIERYAKVLGGLVVLVGTYKTAVVASNLVKQLEYTIKRKIQSQMVIERALRKGASMAIVQEAATTKVLTIAKQGLATSIKNVTKSLLLNPYVLAASAVAALGFAIYKVVTAQDEFEAASLRVNEATSEINKSVYSEMSSLSKLERKLAETKKGSEEWKKVRDEIVSKYGKYHSGLEEEITKVGDLSTAYDELTKNITQSVGARQFESFFQKEQERLDKFVSETLDGAYNRLTEKYGDAQGRRYYSEFFNSVMRGSAVSPEALKALQDTNVGDMRWGDNAVDGIVDFRTSIDQMRTDIRRQREASSQAIEEYKKIYGVTDEQIKEIISGGTTGAGDGGSTPTEGNYGEEYQAARKAWEKAKKELTEVENDRDKFTTKVYTDRAKKEAEAKKTYEALGGDTSGKSTDDDKELVENSIAWYEAQISKLQTLRKSLTDASDFAAVDKNIQQMQVAMGILEDEANVENLDNEAMSMSSGYAEREKETYDERLANFKTFADRYKEIEDEHNSNLELVTAKGGTKADFDAEDQRYEEDLQSLNDEVLATIGDFESLGIEATDKVIDQMIGKLQTAKTALQNDTSGADNSAKISAVNKEIERCIQLKKQNDDTSQSRSLKEWQDMEKQLNECTDSFEQMGEAIGGVAGEVISTAGGIVSSTVSMVSSIAQLVDISINGTKAAAEGASTAIRAVESASVILAVIRAVIQVATKIANLFKANKKAEEDHQKALLEITERNIDAQTQYNALLREEAVLLAELNTIFGNDPYSEAIANTNRYSEAIQELRTAIKGSISDDELRSAKIIDALTNGRENATQNLLKSYQSGTKGLNDIKIVTGSHTERSGFLNLGKKQVDDYSSITSVYSDLVDQFGNLNTERAQTIIDTQKMSDEDKKRLESMIALQKEADEAIQSINDYYSNIFGDMGSSLKDALVDAFRNGTDAGEAFCKNMVGMLEKLGEDFAYSMSIGQVMADQQEKIDAINRDSTLTDQERADKLMALAIETGEKAAAQQDDFNAFLEAYQQGASKEGYSLWEANEERSASSKGIATASQESVDENNGRLTAIQGHTYGLLESVKISEVNQLAIRSSVDLMYSRSGEILNCLYGIKDNTEYCRRLDGMDKDITSIRKGIDSLNKGITLKR